MKELDISEGSEYYTNVASVNYVYATIVTKQEVQGMIRKERIECFITSIVLFLLIISVHFSKRRIW